MMTRYGGPIAFTSHKRGQLLMECARMARLRQDYMAASATFHAARTRLSLRIGICPKSEFQMLRDQLERLSDDLKLARTAFDAHTQEHCCMVQGNSIKQD
jgi:hypothetical protein